MKIGIIVFIISKYENDNYWLLIFILVKLVEIFGIIIDFLLDDVVGLWEKNLVNVFFLIGNLEFEKWYLELFYIYLEDELLMLKWIVDVIENKK